MEPGSEMKIGDLVKNLCRVADLDKVWRDYKHVFENGHPRGISTGWRGFDNYFTIVKGQLNVLTGTPSSGKSEWLMSMTINLASNKNWNFFMFTPENLPLTRILSELAEKFIGKPFTDRWSKEKMSTEEMNYAFDFIKKHYTIVDASQHLYEFKKIIYTVEHSIKTEGRKIDMVVIDPWNSLETMRALGSSETDHIGRCLEQARMFARRMDLSFWIVAHPAKLQRRKDGTFPEPTLYDISGSAHWRNKPDNGLVIHRTDEDMTSGSSVVKVKTAKIKNRNYGKFGEHYFEFQQWNGRYVDWMKQEKESSQLVF
jgi:twinkle protein